MRFYFKNGPPPPRRAEDLPAAKGKALLALLENTAKWLERRKLCGGFDFGDTINGKVPHPAKAFVVEKPPDEQGNPRYRGVKSGAHFKDYCTHTSVLYPNLSEICRMLIKCNSAWKADIEGGYYNFFRQADQMELCCFPVGGKLYVDTTLCQGYPPMALFFSKAIQGMVNALIMKCPLFCDGDRALIDSYLDDMFGGNQQDDKALGQLLVLLLVGDCLGLTWEPSKIE